MALVVGNQPSGRVYQMTAALYATVALIALKRGGGGYSGYK